MNWTNWAAYLIFAAKDGQNYAKNIKNLSVPKTAGLQAIENARKQLRAIERRVTSMTPLIAQMGFIPPQLCCGTIIPFEA